MLGIRFHILCVLFCLLFSSCTGRTGSEQIRITHGPILGRLSHDGIGVWVRTSNPGAFTVRYKAQPESDYSTTTGHTDLHHDNTGWTQLSGLQPNTHYVYDVQAAGSSGKPIAGSFTTLPHADQYRSDAYNPAGLFNFKFEFGCGNNQHPDQGMGPNLPGFKTMLDQLQGDIHFQIMNGDWLYEAQRETPPEQWMKDNGVAAADLPRVVQVFPTIVGVWENYKLYLSRSANLSTWHRYIPAFFTFDDHEILNDVWGAGSAGLRDRRAVYRDTGVQAWQDYLGWSNPPLQPNQQGILFGKGTVSADSDILEDTEADFTALDLTQASNLHIHWGGPTAGVNDNALDEVGGHPAAGVYDIVEVLDANRLRISPPPAADGADISYSIGTKSYYTFRVSNCDFFVLDTRSHREMHDTRDPWKKGLSMLGAAQKDWLLTGMTQSDADFLFVVSSVNFTIPHVGGGKVRASNKDDAWTVFMDEREQLIDFWDTLGKPVFVLTGDLHNSFAIQITDRVWEFASGPHNSGNHIFTDEGNRPASGAFEYNGRTVDIKWSTYWLDDVSRLNLRGPHFCVVQINNVFNSPLQPGEERWVAFPKPQAVFQYYDGLTGELKYAHAISAL